MTETRIRDWVHYVTWGDQRQFTVGSADTAPSLADDTYPTRIAALEAVEHQLLQERAIINDRIRHARLLLKMERPQ